MSTIAVDAMGGDSAPQEIVKGAILAKEEGVEVILSGDKTLINNYLEGVNIPVIDYPEVISMTDNPVVSPQVTFLILSPSFTKT